MENATEVAGVEDASGGSCVLLAGVSEASHLQPSWTQHRRLSIYTLEDEHNRVRQAHKAPGVRDTLAPTYLRRPAWRGRTDGFTIMRAMGHSTVTVSQKYVHPTPEAMERAFEPLEALNQKAAAGLPESEKRRLLATVSATLGEVDVEAVA
jgi:hypothetical protein